MTTTTVHGKTREHVMAAISALNLDPIKFKLMHPEDGKGWTRERADLIERRYRQFLFLTVTSGEPITPTKELDEFWHAHILDTKKYFEDCEQAFGFYLHHFPYFGLRSDEDADNLQRSFAVTQALWEEVFGESLLDDVERISLTYSSCSRSCSACTVVAGSTDLIQDDWRPPLEAAGSHPTTASTPNRTFEVQGAS